MPQISYDMQTRLEIFCFRLTYLRHMAPNTASVIDDVKITAGKIKEYSSQTVQTYRLISPTWSASIEASHTGGKYSVTLRYVSGADEDVVRAWIRAQTR